MLELQYGLQNFHSQFTELSGPKQGMTEQMTNSKGEVEVTNKQQEIIEIQKI